MFTDKGPEVKKGYSDLPAPFRATFQRMAISDDPYFAGGKHLGQEFPIDEEVAIHPNHNGIIVISYPGVMGDIDGYNNKYAKLGDFIQQKIGAVVRTGNHVRAGFEYEKDVQEQLRSVISYSLENSETIAGKGKEDIVLYLMGFSSGAGAIAAVAHEYPQVKKMLLVAASGDAGEQATTDGLRAFSGEVNIVIGENDEIVGVRAGQHFASLAINASKLRSVIIPDCDHQFRGKTNGKIMSSAPIWAFLDKSDESPSPDDGIVLYE